MYSDSARDTSEPVFVNLLRSPGIDSQPGGTDSSEFIPGFLKRLQIRALKYLFEVQLLLFVHCLKRGTFFIENLAA
jgi:hypothetical protein